METSSGPPLPKTQRRRRREVYGPRLDDLAPWELEDILEAMCAIYAAHERDYIEMCDSREREDLRARADGTPSARRPAATLPLSYWATVQPPPDGGDLGSSTDRLAAYQDQLAFWRDKGIYRGPTELTFVNRAPSEPGEEPDADA